MDNAQLARTSIELKDANRDLGLRATGTVITFDGFLKVYFEGHDDVADEDDGARLPQLAEGDNITTREVKPEQHFTEPPPRYTEASLVKKLEELGIGRPSTYAQILSVLRDRKYVHMDRNRFIPEDKGRLVTAFLENFFSRYVEYDFTAGLEQKLDQVSAGELDWREFLHSFWDEFKASVDEISDLRITQVLDALNEALGPHVFPPRSDGTDPRQCPACGDGLLSLKVGRYGAFVGCSNYPDCKYTRAITASDEETSGAEAGPKLLGKDPETGLEVTLREGRFGAYVQLGEAEEKKKPKRTGVPKTMDPATLDLDRALQLLSLPREVGSHPETGKKITAGLGRFGPYVLHDGTYASVPDIEELFSIGINRAVTLLAEKKTRGRRSTSKPLKDLGEHPSKGGRISIMDGRYGPYVKHGRVNASLPAGSDVDSVSLDEAVELIEKKSAKKKSAKSSRTKKKSTKKKVATKNSAKKKVASKTSATEVEETSD